MLVKRIKHIILDIVAIVNCHMTLYRCIDNIWNVDIPEDGIDMFKVHVYVL